MSCFNDYDLLVSGQTYGFTCENCSGHSAEAPKYITYRYARLLRDTTIEYRLSGILYMILSNIVTITMVASTALLSLNQVLNGDLNDPMFWITWSMLVILTISSRILSSCQLDRKYTLSRVMLSRLKAEGWMFTHGAGIYATLERDDRLRAFAARVEKMQIRTLENVASLDFTDTVEILTGSAEDEPPAVYRTNQSIIV